MKAAAAAERTSGDQKTMKTGKAYQHGTLPAAQQLPEAPDPGMPWELLGGGDWRLPSGKPLAEFALQSGFLAPFLLEATSLAPRQSKRDSQRAAKQSLEKLVRAIEVKEYR